MNKKIRWITETAVLLALLVVLQSVTKPLGQLVTGSCVNAVLAIAALFAGMGSGIVVALVSPVLAFLLVIAPQAVTVPAIMVGNTVFVVLLSLLYRENTLRKLLAWLAAAAAKFVTLYLLVTQLICGLAAPALLAAGTLKEPMLKVLPTMFAWPQLATALIGGAIALLITPVLKKALHR
ncbi:MAG: ECF transporter S component [Eubacteriales bacterium]|nr:ECF transporter S component [Eubacteriales bacterium]